MMNILLEAIKEKCLDCCCGDGYEVLLCTCKDCPLYPFRLGGSIENDKGDINE